MPFHLISEEPIMRYRLADNLDLLALCDQPLRLQRILDRKGHSIFVFVRDDHTAVTFAYGVESKGRPAFTAETLQTENGRNVND
jgi:hypothetical protein